MSGQQEVIEPLKKLKDVIQGRWSEYAMVGLENWDVIFAYGEDDYQGSCEYIVRHPSYRTDVPHWYDQWIAFGWSYGSCGGCDGYEDLSDNEIIKAMVNSRVGYGSSQIRDYANRLLEENPEGTKRYWGSNGREKGLAILRALPK